VTRIAAAVVAVLAAGYLWVRLTPASITTSTSSEPASDVDLSSSLDLGAAYGEAGTGFNAGGRTDQIQDNDSTDMDGGMVGL